jgi:hypothetical protein
VYVQSVADGFCALIDEQLDQKVVTFVNFKSQKSFSISVGDIAVLIV